jgi:hypothetical protein
MVLWMISVVCVGLGAYFVGRVAQAKYEDLHTDNTPPLDAKLEQQGRYEEAIQVLLSPNKERPVQAEDYSRVAYLYLEWAKRDLGNRASLAQKSAFYSDKSVQMVSNDPFVLETAMFNLDRAGDYSENGCPYYQKAERLGESVLALAQAESVSIHGRNYPTKYFRESVPHHLDRVRSKVKAWCGKSPNGAN